MTMMRPHGIFADPRRLGLACALAASGLGIAYLAAAGAPGRYPATNAAALAIGLAAFLLVGRVPWQPARLPGLIALAAGAALLATALFGVSVEGASRWVRLGALSVQPSMILLPVMLVLFARCRDGLAGIGIALAAAGLALQPDRAMAGVLLGGLAVVAMARPERQVLAVLGLAAAAFAVTLAWPDSLPAVPFVDRIFYSSFAVHPAAGLAVIGGALLLLVPAFVGGTANRDHLLIRCVFGAAWLGIMIAAALGNYPTPLVGYGGSAIVGYLLSLAALPTAPKPSAANCAAAPGADVRPSDDIRRRAALA